VKLKGLKVNIPLKMLSWMPILKPVIKEGVPKLLLN
jgi:hypothetical protein